MSAETLEPYARDDKRQLGAQGLKQLFDSSFVNLPSNPVDKTVAAMNLDSDRRNIEHHSTRNGELPASYSRVFAIGDALREADDAGNQVLTVNEARFRRDQWLERFPVTITDKSNLLPSALLDAMLAAHIGLKDKDLHDKLYKAAKSRIIELTPETEEASSQLLGLTGQFIARDLMAQEGSGEQLARHADLVLNSLAREREHKGSVPTSFVAAYASVVYRSTPLEKILADEFSVSTYGELFAEQLRHLVSQ